MFTAILATGYELGIRADDMDIIDIAALKQHITQHRDSVWDGLDVYPRTCPSHLPFTEGQVLHISEMVCQAC